MGWHVTFNLYGSVEDYDVEGATISEAIANALEDSGLGDNDEGGFTMEITGAAD